MYRLSPNQPENTDNIIILKPINNSQSHNLKPFQLKKIPSSSSFKFIKNMDFKDYNNYLKLINCINILFI